MVSFSKRKNPLPCEKCLFLFWNTVLHALNGFASQCSCQGCGVAEQTKNGTHRIILFNIGRQIHLMTRSPKHLQKGNNFFHTAVFFLRLCPQAKENHLIWNPMGANNCPVGRQLALASETSMSGRDLNVWTSLTGSGRLYLWHSAQ